MNTGPFAALLYHSRAWTAEQETRDSFARRGRSSLLDVTLSYKGTSSFPVHPSSLLYNLFIGLVGFRHISVDLFERLFLAKKISLLY